MNEYNIDNEKLRKLGWDLDQCTKDGCVYFYGQWSDEGMMTIGGRDLGYIGEGFLTITNLKNNEISFLGKINWDNYTGEIQRLTRQLQIGVK